MSDWLEGMNEPRGRPVILCFPAAGGDLSRFRGWRRARPDLCLGTVELPGHFERVDEPPVSSVPIMAAGVAEELRDAAVPGVHLLGTSLGAVLAYETALLLPRPPIVASLTVVSCPSPDHLRERTSTGRLARGTLEAFQELGSADVPSLSPELVQILLPAWRADLQAARGYQPPPASDLGIPMHLVLGRDDHFVDDSDVEGWARLSSSFTNEWVDGRHFVWDDQPPPWLQETHHQHQIQRR